MRPPQITTRRVLYRLTKVFAGIAEKQMRDQLDRAKLQLSTILITYQRTHMSITSKEQLNEKMEPVGYISSRTDGTKQRQFVHNTCAKETGCGTTEILRKNIN